MVQVKDSKKFVLDFPSLSAREIEGSGLRFYHFHPSVLVIIINIPIISNITNQTKGQHTFKN